MRFTAAWRKRALSRAATWRSNSAGRTVATTGCRRWPPISCAAGWPSLRPPDRRRRGSQPRRPRPQSRSSFRPAAIRSRTGLVASMNRPGGNITGVSRMNVALAPKRLELLHEAIPKATLVALLVNADSPRADGDIASVREAARSLGLTARDCADQRDERENELDSAFATIVQKRVDALLVDPAPVPCRVRSRCAGATPRDCPRCIGTRDDVAAGGLMSYGSSIDGSLSPGRRLRRPHPQGRKACRSAGPAGRPSLSSFINLKTAKALGHRHSAEAARVRRRGDRVRRASSSRCSAAPRAAWPLTARAQQPAMPVIGVLSRHASTADAHLAAFHQGLNDAGYVEGHNVTIEYRWPRTDNTIGCRRCGRTRPPPGRCDRCRCSAPAPALAAKAATATIPIVFLNGGDPVEDGLVASLNRPGGNVTGVTFIYRRAGGQAAGAVARTGPEGFLDRACSINPTNPLDRTQLRDLQAGGSRTSGLQIACRQRQQRWRDRAGLCGLRPRSGSARSWSAANSLFSNRRDQVVALAARHALPDDLLGARGRAAGGLMSYGASVPDAFRQVGIYTGRILKGEKPADLPVHAADQVRVRHQPQDRQGARPRRAARRCKRGRRGDRVRRRAVHHAARWRGGALLRFSRARAAAQAMPVIGFLDVTTAVDSAYRLAAFRRGLSEAGFVDGQNVTIEYALGGRPAWDGCRRWRPIWSAAKWL